MINEINPWESADNPQMREYSSQYWGKVEASSWFCVLEKGVGKTVYDPQKHSPDQRRTAVEILFTPLPDMGLQFNIERSILAESVEWARITLPSIHDCGIMPRELDGKWAKIELVPIPGKDGQPLTYTDSAGVVKEKKALKFLAIFDTEDACRNDYATNGGATPQPQSQNNGGNGGERETALKFLRVYVQNACRGQNDLTVIRNILAAQIAGQALIAKYFTIDSPETLQLIAEEMSHA